MDKYEKGRGGKWSKMAGINIILQYSQDCINGIEKAKFIKLEVLDGKSTLMLEGEPNSKMWVS